MKTPIDRKQIQIIKIAQKQLCLDDGTYRALLQSEFGRKSCTALSQAQADRLIGIFKQRGFVVRSRVKARRSRKGRKGLKRKAGADVQTIVSRGEIDKIQAVAGLIEWRTANGLERWINKRFGLARVRTSHDAFRVIEGLKKMFENRMKKAHGPAWWVRVYEDPAVEVYKTEHCPERYVLRMMQARAKAMRGEDVSRKDAKNAKNSKIKGEAET